MKGLCGATMGASPLISRREESAGLAEWRVARAVTWRAGRVVFAALTITRLVDEVWETMLVGKQGGDTSADRCTAEMVGILVSVAAVLVYNGSTVRALCEYEMSSGASHLIWNGSCGMESGDMNRQEISRAV